MHESGHFGGDDDLADEFISKFMHSVVQRLFKDKTFNNTIIKASDHAEKFALKNLGEYHGD